MDTGDNGAARFRDIPGRNASDDLLRTTQQHRVHLSAMADTKANIVITVSSIVLTLSLGRLNDQGLHHAMAVLAVFTLLALFPSFLCGSAGAVGVPFVRVLAGWS